jgi:plastocyanin
LQKGRWLHLIGVAAALGAFAVIGIGGSASATSKTAGAKPGVTKVKIEFDRKNKDLSFQAPATVAAGDQLQIKNNTNPRAIGPHTFSVVHQRDLPKGKAQIKACAKKLKGICGAIVKWHQVDIQTGQIGENPVEVGKNGWDTAGSLKHKGDSVVLTRKGEKFQRPVTAPVGKTLYFVCAVHPSMQGKITVVAGS